jgi:hypothetical protein
MNFRKLSNQFIFGWFTEQKEKEDEYELNQIIRNWIR